MKTNKIKEETRNKCDECKTELVKTYVFTEFKIPFVCWVCPKSECFQLYEKEFMKKYHKNIR